MLDMVAEAKVSTRVRVRVRVGLGLEVALEAIVIISHQAFGYIIHSRYTASTISFVLIYETSVH